MNVNGKFDLWLVRISYIAQVGLFFLTIFTIYFTVIPIYQNASLQESIAKKEIEYKQLERKRTLYPSPFRIFKENFCRINNYMFSN